MNTKRNKMEKASLVPKEIKESDVWNDGKMKKLREFIVLESKKQSPERRLRNEVLSIKYQMQDYLKKDKVEREIRIVDFVKLYLRLFKFSQRDLASAFEMKDSNLYKYLKGERKLNPDIALKLSSFSHTEPELWYNIQTKNELFELGKEKLKKYEKYGYEKLVSAH